MNAFLKDILYFIGFFCILMVILDIFIDYHPNEFSTKYNNWGKNRNITTTLLIGNSHIQANVNADMIGDSAFNMAIGGSNIQQALSIACTYIPQMENLKTIIINFDYNNVYDTNGNLYTKETCKRERGKSNWGDYLNYIHYRYLHAGTVLTRFDHAISCNQIHYSTLLNNNLTDINLDKLDETFHDNPYYSIPAINMDQYNKYVSSLAMIAKIASDNHLNLIIITSPAHNRFRSQTTKKNLELMQFTMDSLSRIYPLRYKNYLFDTIFSQKDMYADIHHLTREGASIFAHIIKNDFDL